MLVHLNLIESLAFLICSFNAATMSSNTASVIEVIIIGYSITDNMVCTEYQCIGYVRYTVFKSVTCFQIPNDDTDTVAYKLEQAFLLPLLEGARQNARTASNAVNKVRDLEVSAKAGAGWAQSGSYNWSHKVNKININEFQPFCLHCILLLCSDSSSTSWSASPCICSSDKLWSRRCSAC